MNINDVKHNFTKAATNYHDNAIIQQISAHKIIQLLQFYYNNHTSNALMLDLGSGSGTIDIANIDNTLNDNSVNINHIKQNVINYDVSLAMLHHNNQSRYKINGDAHNIAIIDNSIAYVISNLMIQWGIDKNKIISEVYRILQVNGIAIISTLAAPSLYELQQVWSMVDYHNHTIKFLYNSDYLCTFNNNKFKILQNITWQHTIYFNDLLSLLKHFKLSGTNLTKSTIGNHLNSRTFLEKLNNHYQKIAVNGMLPITYVYALYVLSK